MAEDGSSLDVDRIVPEHVQGDSDTSSSQEHAFLREQAAKAALRAVVASDAHIKAAEAELARLRLLLEADRNTIDLLSPRVSELEQAERTSKLNGWQSAFFLAAGGGLLSCAGYFKYYQAACIGGGWTALVAGALLLGVSNGFGWPPRRQ